MPKERNKAAFNYGFTVDELKERKGLKQFFVFFEVPESVPKN